MTSAVYMVYGEDEYLLPEFPIDKPATFQILESDCKINASLAEHLRFKYFECQNASVEAFVTENLSKLLSVSAASVFSWNGNQGTIPVMKFKTMKILIGSSYRASNEFIIIRARHLTLKYLFFLF